MASGFCAVCHRSFKACECIPEAHRNDTPRVEPTQAQLTARVRELETALGSARSTVKAWGREACTSQEEASSRDRLERLLAQDLAAIDTALTRLCAAAAETGEREGEAK